MSYGCGVPQPLVGDFADFTDGHFGETQTLGVVQLLVQGDFRLGLSM